MNFKYDSSELCINYVFVFLKSMSLSIYICTHACANTQEKYV